MQKSENTIVREFRHMLLWPLQLRRLSRDGPHHHHWEALRARPGPWREVKDNLLVDDETCQLGYREFVYFLPYVQRFLYGFGESDAQTPSSLHMFRRTDIAKAIVRLAEDAPALELDVERLRLTFFYDVDIALLTCEVVARDIPLADAVEIIDRFGRPYPPSWDGAQQPHHCSWQVEFRDVQGRLLTASDYGDRDKYVGLVRDIKQTPLSLHWENLLKPLVPAYLGGGQVQYYQIENKRIPIMSYLAFDDPNQLTRGDLARICFAAKWGEPDTLPFSSNFLEGFEERYCYDRFWDPASPELNTRYTICGPAFAMITKHGEEERVQAFRHQFYQIGMIVNFHKGALLNLSNRFSIAVERLRVGDYDSVRLFKRSVREALELFLRFNHRYWFTEISHQVLADDFYTRWSGELRTDKIYNEVREEARDINEYLDADRTRRFSNNAQRLTVVSACGMVGTVVTGFLGMNLFAHADLGGWEKTAIFVAVFIPTILITGYTVMISHRLANFMEALASESLTWAEKKDAFRQIWMHPSRARLKRVAGGDHPTRRSARRAPPDAVASSD
ncbi:MAG TPA: CorA family divalent cation transporter [Usitatibacter sp.]|nr:CorA family divalent cation transporter [Usitatibacter sp.]